MNPVSRDTSFAASLANERPTKFALASGSPWCVPEFVRSALGCFAIVVLMSSATNALAQPIKLPSPADSEAAVSELKYESAFSGYQPFQEQKSNAWKQVNKEVADNPGMGSMKDMSGKTMTSMDSKTADAPMSKEGADAQDMHSMKGMPDKAMPEMDSRTTDESKGKEGHDAMPKAKPQAGTVPSANAQTASIVGTGIVQVIDRANGKVKLSHEPIAALGWPKMTMFFRLKDSALAEQVKEGDRVQFSLEKSASGYVISGFQKGAASHDMKKTK